MEDDELVNQVQADNKKAFEILLRRHKGKIYNAVFRILHNRDDAMDITMEAFFIAYTRIRTLKDNTKFGSWLIGIARNLALMRLRGKHPEVSIEEPGLSKHLLIPFSDDISKEELRNILRREIDRLPHKYRRAFILREIERWPYGRIASELGITQTNAKVRVSRAKDMLRTRLSRYL